MKKFFYIVTVATMLVACGDEESSIPAIGEIQGTVTRTATATSADGQAGDLYISVFEVDPIQNRNEDTLPVASLTIRNVELGAEGSQVSFVLSEIPTRTEPYVLTAVFDANQNLAQLDPPGPDDGDLVALQGIKSPEIVVNAATVSAEIELNFECTEGICDPLN